MISEWLVKIFVKDCGDTNNRHVRERYGRLVGWVGILCNIFLFIVKLIAGLFLQSVSIMADSFNNLSDSASSVITLIGFKMSGKPADKEHPFGHGRIEYIAAFIVSFVIMLLGYEFLTRSVSKIISPEPVLFHAPSVCVLILSIFIKVWLSVFNRDIGQRIGSQALSAAAADSRNDVIITSATIASILFTHYTGMIIDGYIGALVAIFILYSGFNIAKETLSPLLGESADPALASNIKSDILSYPGIIGAHDLIVHNYGPNNIMATIHAEMPADIGIVAAHEIIDRAEIAIGEKYGVLLVIHLDPFPLDNERLSLLKAVVDDSLQSMPDALNAHDYRLVNDEGRINLVFDLQVPHSYTDDQTEKVKNMIAARVKTVDADCALTINSESGFDMI